MDETHDTARNVFHFSLCARTSAAKNASAVNGEKIVSVNATRASHARAKRLRACSTNHSHLRSLFVVMCSVMCMLFNCVSRRSCCFKQGKRSLAASHREYHCLALETHHHPRRQVGDKRTSLPHQHLRVGKVRLDSGQHLALFGTEVYLEFQEFVAAIYIFDRNNF